MDKRIDKHFGDLFRPVFSRLEQDTIARVENGDIDEEDHITSSLFTLAAERINALGEELASSQQVAKPKLTARQFKGRGRNSDEFFSGADGAVALHIKLDSIEIQKFYIFQAKKSIQSKFDDHAIRQRERMLSCTPDSFFLIYSPDKIQFISAFIAEEHDAYSDLPAKPFTEFHEDFFNCFIGDHFNGFPDLPYRRPWRYWPYEDYPFAKDNLIIEISE